MRKTNQGNRELAHKENIRRMSVSTEELQLMLGCGRKTAVYSTASDAVFKALGVD